MYAWDAAGAGLRRPLVRGRSPPNSQPHSFPFPEHPPSRAAQSHFHPSPPPPPLYSYLESTARECAPLSLSRAGSSSPLLGGAPEGSGSGIGGRGEACRGCTTSTSTEAAYAREYEARISPFNAFRRRERQVSQHTAAGLFLAHPGVGDLFLARTGFTYLFPACPGFGGLLLARLGVKTYS